MSIDHRNSEPLADIIEPKGFDHIPSPIRQDQDSIERRHPGRERGTGLFEFTRKQYLRGMAKKRRYFPKVDNESDQQFPSIGYKRANSLGDRLRSLGRFLRETDQH